MHVSLSFYPVISADKKKFRVHFFGAEHVHSQSVFMSTLCLIKPFNDVSGTLTGALAHNGRDKTVLVWGESGFHWRRRGQKMLSVQEMFWRGI